MNNIRNVSISASIILHSVVFGIGSSPFIPKLKTEIPLPKNTDIELQFIDTQETAEEKKPVEKSKYISDKPQTAKDMEKGIEDRKSARLKEPLKGKQLAQIKTMPLQSKTIPEHPIIKKSPDIQSNAAKTAEKAKIKRDDMSIPEISDSVRSTLEEGDISFEADKHKLGPYFKNIKNKIGSYWLGYLVFTYPNTAPVESEASVSFDILPDGRIKDLKVLEYKGGVVFRDFCAASIANTSPFPPLPKHIKEVEKKGSLNIVFTFRYR